MRKIKTNKDGKVQAAEHLIARNHLSSKYMWQKTEVGGLFFTVNLVPSLNMAVHGMQHERLLTTEGHHPTTSKVAAVRNS